MQTPAHAQHAEAIGELIETPAQSLCMVGLILPPKARRDDPHPLPHSECLAAGAVSAGQGGGVDQAYDGWRVVSQFEFQQWVESRHSAQTSKKQECANSEGSASPPNATRLRLLAGNEKFAFKSLFHAWMLFPAC
jgi:hypothetical protein